MPRLRTVRALRPAETGRHDGLDFALWMPDAARYPPPPTAGVVLLHGAGSQKESHYDFARGAVALGLAALSFDARGHGQSDGPMDGRAVEDVVTMARLLRRRVPGVEVGLRGSSMGGYLALLAAGPAAAGAVVAICPASGEGLLRGLRAGRFPFSADRPGLEALLSGADLAGAVSSLTVPVQLLHAEGDEVVPVAHSRELAHGLRHPRSRLIVLPGGHHRSIQHDEELQAVSLRMLVQSLGAATARPPRGPEPI